MMKSPLRAHGSGLFQRSDIMISVKCYKYSGNPKRINKDGLLQNEITLNCSVKEVLDIMNPVFYVEYDSRLLFYNYVSANGRFYFMRPEVDPGGAMRLHCSEDVLYTWKAGVLAAPCVCARSKAKYNGAIDDPRYPVLKRSKIESWKLFEISNDDQIVLAYVE